MQTVKDAALGILVFAAFIAVLKFVCIPSSGHLVPIIENGNHVTGYEYRVDSWWGLAHANYPASIDANGPTYQENNREKSIMVPTDAYAGN